MTSSSTTVRIAGATDACASQEVCRFMEKQASSPRGQAGIVASYGAGPEVPDEAGMSRVVFHGTVDEFDEFLPLSHFGGREAAVDRLAMISRGRQGRIVSARLSIRNPLRVPDYHDWSDAEVWHDRIVDGSLRADQVDAIDREVRAILEASDCLHDTDVMPLLARFLSENGYDGIVYANRFEGRRDEDSWIVFDPEHVQVLTVEIVDDVPASLPRI